MNKYLLEIGTEELAYKFIPSAVEQLKSGFSKILDEYKIEFSDIKTYATPRRLAVIIEGLPDKQKDIQKLIKGPVSSIAYDSNGSLTKAGLGFADKNGILPDNLFQKDNYVWANIEQKGSATADILKTIVPQIISEIKGTHFMRWADLDIKFQRPIRWIVSLFNDSVLEVETAGVVASNISRGHRFSNSVDVVINSPDEYLAKLRDANVIADVQERRNKIVMSSEAKAGEIGADIIIDENLLDEIVFITEWPVPVICSFDEKYLQIPDKVTVTVMAVHQRYFPLYKNGRLLNKFITVSNYTGCNFDNIKAGNERVVTARLEDAVFFVQEDTRRPLIDYLDELKGVTFQKGLGSVYDKTNRIIKISKFIAEKLNVPAETIERTALLCKADLVTKLVFEFTELQGYIGADYALRSGEAPEVALGIKEHYYPLNSESGLAGGIEGQVAGIADKIDTITAVFAGGRKISGSQDPLGVRRATLGVLKTVILKNLDIDLSELIKYSISILPVQIEDKSKLYSSVKEFFEQRLITLLSDKYQYSVIGACLGQKDVLADLKDFIKRLDILSDMIEKENFAQFSGGINRIINIIKNENNISEVNPQLFTLNEEKILWDNVKNIDETKLSCKDLVNKLFILIPFINGFFDKVLVMDKDDKIKQNRVNLLYLTKTKFDKIADFSRLSL